MDPISLEQWIKTHSIIERTINGFWVCFKNYLNEYPEEVNMFSDEINLDDITIKVDTIAYKTTFHPEYQIADSEYSQEVVSIFDVLYRNKNIGYYKMFFYLDGECYDDSLVTEWTKWYITIKLESLIELQRDLNNELINNNVKVEEASIFQNILESKITKIRAQIYN
ncbi:hypothetical protein [Cohnella terricola]|uniref:Uncharacterized protein n=1 Tax=Cohnella terricola TaxID=1289167 RepID=A0A559J8M8_9BACL|nr:hypothetical protein [Cohnella terricola]TVX96233.1 hypothetical protein FPZ45_21205 [Cohnella terricola]